MVTMDMSTIAAKSKESLIEWWSRRFDEEFLNHLTIYGASSEISDRYYAAARKNSETLRRIQGMAESRGGAYHFTKWQREALMVSDDELARENKECLRLAREAASR